MNKKLFRRLLASALALCLVFSLSACGKGSDDEDPGLPHAEAGGSDVPYADGFDTTVKFNTGMPNARAIRATRRPMLPYPTSPSVLLRSSVPLNTS